MSFFLGWQPAADINWSAVLFLAEGVVDWTRPLHLGSARLGNPPTRRPIRPEAIRG